MSLLYSDENEGKGYAAANIFVTSDANVTIPT
jgi:hypothetical protein